MARAPDTARTRRGVSTRKILALNGPNLNLLESREPESCGGETPWSIIQRLSKATTGQGAHSSTDYRRRRRRDLLLSSSILRSSRSAGSRCVSLANIHAREALRRHAYFSDLAVGTICGMGSRGCDLALECALGNKSETDATGIAFPDIGEHEGRRGAALPPRVVAT